MKLYLFFSKLVFFMFGSLVLAMAGVNCAYATGPEWVGAYAMSSSFFAQFGVNKAAYAAGGAGAGPIVMSTLVGGAAGFGTAKLMNDHILSDCQNPKACDAAKVGTYAGATIGTAGIVATVAVVGINATGLATIGAAIGGGMAAGVTALVAAPIVAVIAVGGATYWWFSGEGENNGDKP